MTIAASRRSFLASTALAVGTPDLLAAIQPGNTIQLPIKVGQIGTSHSHASGKWETINQFPDLYDVIGIAEPNQTRRLQLIDRSASYRNAKWMDESQLLDQASLIVVETDVPDLVPTALRAIKADKHLHLDKPGGTNLPDFVALLDEAARRKRIIQMGYMFRYNAAFVLLFQAVREGWLGNIREVNGVIGKRASRELRQQLAVYPGGGMFELGCHLIDAAVTVLVAPEKVHAFNRTTRDDGFQDNQLAVLEYPNATATIRCNHVDPFGGPRRQFSVIGDAGSIEIRPLEPPAVTLMLDQPRGDYKQGTQQIKFPPAGRYDGDFKALAAVLSGTQDFPWDYSHDAAVQQAVLEASGTASPQR